MTRQEQLRLEIKRIREILTNPPQDETEPHLYNQWAESSLLFCLDAMEELMDENESVWDMIDEIKASEIANYSEEFRQMMDRKLLEIKMLAATKPGLA